MTGRLRSRATISGALLALAALAGTGGCESAAPPPPAPAPARRPTVVLVSLDTLRPDRLSGYGYDRPTSPFLDALAAQSVLFTQARCQSVGTLTSHLSLMTSLYPLHLQITRADGENDDMVRTKLVLPERVLTLAEALAGAGYQPVAFTGGGFVAADYGMGQGFELYDENRATWGFIVSLGRLARFLAMRTRAGDDRPLMLFVHTFDVHAPYEAPDPIGRRFSRESYAELAGRLGFQPIPSLLNDRLDTLDEDTLAEVSDLYDNGIRSVDLLLQGLTRLLDDYGLFDDAVFIVLSDHGEEFLEHGKLNHGASVYEELVRVPLLVRLPGGKDGGTIVDTPVALLDVAPTVLDLAGVPVPDQFQGRSLRGLMEGGDGKAFRERPLLLDVPSKDSGVYGMVQGDTKIVSRGRSGAPELFNLSVDPRERDISGRTGAPPGRWLTEMESLRSAVARAGSTRGWMADAQTDRRKQDLSPEAIERLRALGYLK